VESGYLPGGLYRNRNYRLRQVEKVSSCPDWIFDVGFDPQTAGGLFFSLPAAKAAPLAEAMRRAGIRDAAVVGDVVADHPGKIFLE
jgi:selenide,water dikinase